MTDDLSDYGKLNEMRKELWVALATSRDLGESHRIRTLIVNIDNLKRDPTDKALLAQFAKNTADLERYKLTLR